MSAFDTTNPTRGRTIVGIFHDRSDAEAAIEDLKRAGFTNEQIGVAMRDRGEQKDLAEGTDTSATSAAATGAVSGGIVGGLIGLLGSLLLPGIGPIVAGGVLASTLVGAGAGAATGGIIGALVGMGVSEEDATHFDSRFREGAILVTVNAGDRVEEAVRIFRAHGADLGPSRAAGRADVEDMPIVAEVASEEIILEMPVTPEETQVGGEDVSERGRTTPGRRAAYSGRERRRSRDTSYAGPERRMVSL